MEQRIKYTTAAPGIYEKMLGLHRYLEECGLDKRLMNLAYLRASQINRCAYCIDMHWKDLRQHFSERDLANLTLAIVGSTAGTA